MRRFRFTRTELRTVVVVIIELLGLLKAFPHHAHLPRERVNFFDEDSVFEFPHDFLAIRDGVEIVQACIEERREIVVFPAGRDGFHDLVEMQIAEEGRSFEHLSRRILVRSLE
ncbi:MAG: hypothetical protein ACLPZF_24210 [Candidatus Acidiferrales bacterium]